MKSRGKSKYYIFPHITASIFACFFFLIIFIVVFIFLVNAGERVSDTIIMAFSIVYFVVYFSLIIILNVFFWNAVVIFDCKGMRQRHGLSIIEWRWDEIEDVQCRLHRFWPLKTSAGAMWAPKFIFASSKHKIKLSVVMEKHTRQVLFRMCKNEELKEQCIQLLQSCDFSYI